METASESLISLASVDYGIVAVYFVATVAAGLFLSRKAAAGIEDYFLGGRRIPWWVMGASGTASNLDMTGTMVIVSFFFARGLQGFWVAMRGGIALPLGILMGYMGRWLQRSRVMTTAEWMELRFGSGPAGRAARVLSAVSSLIVTVGFIVYFCKGSGKFLSVFLPFSPNACAALMVSIGLVYTAASGLYGVVYTDLLQEALLLITAAVVVYTTVTLPDHGALISAAGSDWVAIAPKWRAEPMNWLADPHAYEMFGWCILAWISRGILEGAGGFSGGYMPQRYYAAASEREASLLTAEWVLLLSVRWALVMSLALLGIKVARDFPALGNVLSADPEKTLPIVLGQLFPVGLKGIAVAGLVAAAMSTFDSTVNAGASYWVKDIYQRFFRPDADERALVRQSYLSTAVIALVSLVLALLIHNIDEIWSWVTGPLSAGLFIPVVLRWYWWRFNGWGYAIATGVGLVAAIAIKLVAPDLALYVSFPLTSTLSFLGGLIATYATVPTPQDELLAFYERVKPAGLWGPVKAQLGPTSAIVKSQRAEEYRLWLNTPSLRRLALSAFPVCDSHDPNDDRQADTIRWDIPRPLSGALL